VRPGVPATFNASASKDPDGTISTYAWRFGNGAPALRSAPKATRVFPTLGTFQVTLTLTDNEGCSIALVYTGQTASCNGSRVATATETVKVAYPGVRVKCPGRAKKRSCKFKLKVIGGKPKKGRKTVVQSAVARVKVKAGKSAIVSLKAKRAFRLELARARSVLVVETEEIDGTRRPLVRKLRIVR
jgi:hypothetical protein